MTGKKILLPVLFCVLALSSCGQKKEEKALSSEIDSSTDETVLTMEAETASETEEETPATGSNLQTESAEEKTDASDRPCKVVRHDQVGTAMVTALGKTISVPTSFSGLEKEDFEFEGADVVLQPGESGSCRVKYKGSYSHIKLNVKNTTSDGMLVRDCTIHGIEVVSLERDPDLTLYGIPMGATWTDVLSTYGQPFSQTEPGENHVYSVTYQFGTDINSEKVIFIYFKDGNVIDATYDDFSLITK